MGMRTLQKPFRDPFRNPSETLQRALNGGLDLWGVGSANLGRPIFVSKWSQIPLKQAFSRKLAQKWGAPNLQIQRPTDPIPHLKPAEETLLGSGGSVPGNESLDPALFTTSKGGRRVIKVLSCSLFAVYIRMNHHLLGCRSLVLVWGKLASRPRRLRRPAFAKGAEQGAQSFSTSVDLHRKQKMGVETFWVLPYV